MPSERLTLAWLERLQRAKTREDVLAAVWDLRDNAYDLPEAWKFVTPVRFLQYLGESLEDATDEATNWDYFGALIGEVIAKARSGLPTNWDG